MNGLQARQEKKRVDDWWRWRRQLARDVAKIKRNLEIPMRMAWFWKLGLRHKSVYTSDYFEHFEDAIFAEIQDAWGNDVEAEFDRDAGKIIVRAKDGRTRNL